MLPARQHKTYELLEDCLRLHSVTLQYFCRSMSQFITRLEVIVFALRINPDVQAVEAEDTLQQENPS